MPTTSKVPSEYTIAVPSDTMALPVYMNTWARIKQQVTNCKRGVSFWGSLFPTFLGVLVSSAVPAFIDVANGIKAPQFAITPWMVAFVVSLAIEILSFKAYADALNHESQSVQTILDEMEELQSRFTKIA
jgi:hypothetical protein